MKKAIVLLCLFITSALTNISQTIIVLNKGDLYKPPLDQMVVMDKYTFGGYHYTAEKYDSLKVEIQQLDSLLAGKDSLQDKLLEEYESAIQLKDLEVNTYKTGFSEVKGQLNTSIEKGNQLQTEYKRLENRNQRAKRWRNFFMGTALVSTTLLFLIITL